MFIGRRRHRIDCDDSADNHDDRGTNHHCHDDLGSNHDHDHDHDDP